jgi:hypothetical protein
MAQRFLNLAPLSQVRAFGASLTGDPRGLLVYLRIIRISSQIDFAGSEVT